ncbi:MAG: hypothetical protein V2A72_08085 [Candidatus Omnitrophota bacterium]
MKTFIVVLIAAVITAALFFSVSSLKAEQGEPTIKDLAKQLEQALQNQADIIAKLGEIKEELKIIKVRSTLR